MYLTPSGPSMGAMRGARAPRSMRGLRGLRGAVDITPATPLTVNTSGVVSAAGSPVTITASELPTVITPTPSVATSAQDTSTGYATTPEVLPTSGTPINTILHVGGGNVNPINSGIYAVGTGAAQTGTASSAASTTGTPVPAGYPTDQIYVDPTTGAFYEYSATQNAWVDVGTPYNTGSAATSSTSTYANSPVPSTWSTSTPYEDSSGNWWVFNGQSWVNQGTSGYYSGTAIPISTPTNEIYTDAEGNQWIFSNGSWQLYNYASGVSTTSALTAGGAPAAATTSTTAAAPVSGTQSLLDWFSESTLVSGIPNWVFAAGAGLLALKLWKKR